MTLRPTNPTKPLSSRFNRPNSSPDSIVDRSQEENMPSASATKASDKAQACKKLTTLLQKEYGKSVPSIKQPVLETMLFAVCLEDNPWEKAQAGYDKLLKSYFDLNEIRVSSVTELEQTLSDLRSSEWKGLRIRSILRFVFESTYTFEFEKLARLTLESAQKRLKKIDYLSPFVTNFTLQQVLSSHVVCLDHICHRAAIHLGIVPPDSAIPEATEFLKAGVKKSDAFAFSYLLRQFATDPKFADRIEDELDEDLDFDVLKVEERLAILKAPRRRKKKTAKPAAAEKPATKKKSTKATAAQKKTTSTSKSAAKKESPAKKKTATKAPAAKKKTASKKTSAKTTTSKKSAAKKTTSSSGAKAKKKAPAKRAAKKKK
jgi:endonuclease-3